MVNRAKEADDCFTVRVALMSDEYHHIREAFFSNKPTPWPGSLSGMGYWVDSIVEDSGSPWVEVRVVQDGRLAQMTGVG